MSTLKNHMMTPIQQRNLKGETRADRWACARNGEKQVSVKEGASVSASSSTFLSYPFALISHRSDDPVEDTPWRVTASYEKGELRFAFHDGDGGDCGYAARAMDAGCDAGTLSVTLSVFTEEIKNATLAE